MAVEENEWRNTQTLAADLKDEFIPGCYTLDIGLKGLPYKKIWIRAEYIRIFNYLCDYFQQDNAFNNLAPAVVVTGQPGIGKSVWIYYALRRCLAERTPVIWYFGGASYLFVEEGVYLMPTTYRLKKFVWTLVDSDESKEGVPPHFARPGTRHFLVFSTSPEKQRWSRLHKTMRDTVVVMNPWTRAEILQAASLLPNKPFTDDSINEIFAQLGPIPRLCLDYQANPERLDEYKRNLTTTIESMTTTKIEKLLKTPQYLDIDDLPHNVCLIRREKEDEVFSYPVVSVITPTIQSRLARKLLSLQKEELLHL